MKNFTKILRKLTLLKWYYQLLLALIVLVSIFGLYKLLSWILPFILGGLLLIGIFTEGEAFSMMWNSYKQSRQLPVNPLYNNFYHWLTESGVGELPIVTLQFIQGVECSNATQGIFYIHIEKLVSEKELSSFELKARQTIKMMSNDSVDCIVSIVKREPFLAIKIRLISANEMLVKKQHIEEDF